MPRFGFFGLLRRLRRLLAGPEWRFPEHQLPSQLHGPGLHQRLL